jgi:hypothetical protein
VILAAREFIAEQLWLRDEPKLARVGRADETELASSSGG